MICERLFAVNRHRHCPDAEPAREPDFAFCIEGEEACAVVIKTHTTAVPLVREQAIWRTLGPWADGGDQSSIESSLVNAIRRGLLFNADTIPWLDTLI